MSRAGFQLSETARERALLALLALVVSGSVLAVGGVLPGLVLAIGAACLPLALLAASLQHPTKRPSPLPFWVLLALPLYCLVQLIPMPLSWLATLSPAAADVWARALLPQGGGVTFAPLSLDPPATALEAVKWGSYAAAFLAACVLASRRGPELLVAMVFTSAVLVAAATLGHEVFGATKVFGIYEPRNAAVFAHVGPLLNENSLSGYLNLGAIAGLGLLKTRRFQLSPYLVATGLILLVVMSFRSGSRAGILVLPFGVVLLGAFVLGIRRRQHQASEGGNAKTWQAYATMGVGAALAIGVALFVMDEALWRDVSDEHSNKLLMGVWAAPMLRQHALFGIGRGAFESVFVAYRPAFTSHMVHTHAENFVVQWGVEWGLGVSVVALAIMLWCFRPSIIGARRSVINAAAFAALVTLFLHNLADLGLELPGVALAVAVLLGALWGDVRLRGSDKSRSVFSRYGVWSAPLVLGVAWLTSLSIGPSSLGADRDHVRALIETGSNSPEGLAATRAELSRQMLRHPADYYFPMMGAVLSWTRRDGDAMPWLQRALERGPNVGRTHLLLAEVLLRRGARAQFLMELGYAVTYEPTLASPVARVALRISPTFKELKDMQPEGATGALLMEGIAQQLPWESPLREQLDAAAATEFPDAVAPRERMAVARLTALDSGVRPCLDRYECVSEIETLAQAISRISPRSSRGEQILSRLFMVEGMDDLAHELLVEACKKPEDLEACLQHQARVEPLETLPSVLDRYAASACRGAAKCAAAWDYATGLLVTRGATSHAHVAARKAADQEPTVARWKRAAELAAIARQPTAAADCLERGLRLEGLDAATIRQRVLEQRTTFR